MFGRIVNNLTNPVTWGAFIARYIVMRMLEVRNVVGLGKLIQPGQSNSS